MEIQHASELHSGNKRPILTLKRLCETRWGSRYRAVHAIFANYSAILEALSFISEHDTSKSGADANSFLFNISTFQFFFYTNVLNCVLEITNILSEYLQREQITVKDAKEVAHSTTVTLKDYRTDIKFDKFWTEAHKAMSEYNLQEPVLYRSRRPPQRIDEGSSSCDNFSDVKQSFRVVYYEFLDVLVQELSSRFKDKDLSVLVSLEKLFVGAYRDSEPSEECLKDIANFYQSDIEEERLRNELKVFYSFVKRHVSTVPQAEPIIKLTKLLIECGLSVFPQVAQLARLYLLVPVSSCSAERSFSVCYTV